jgi:predicted nuclease of restriction endonuclease-like (RecB) superfamily
MNKAISISTYHDLISRIADILIAARTKVVREVNKAQVLAYWEIGREIVEFEQKGRARADYGEELLKRLSADMTAKFGRGFSAENLRLMRKFYITFRKSKTLSVKSEKSQTPSDEFEPMLSWFHYCELLKVEEPLARSFYSPREMSQTISRGKQESIQNSWSVRELKRQINSMLFERLAHSKDTKAVMGMAKKGQIIEKPEDTIKDPYILEFLNLKEETSYTETQFEQAIIDKLQYFLLALPSEQELRLKLKSIPLSLGDKHDKSEGGK